MSAILTVVSLVTLAALAVLWSSNEDLQCKEHPAFRSVNRLPEDATVAKRRHLEEWHGDR